MYKEGACCAYSPRVATALRTSKKALNNLQLQADYYARQGRPYPIANAIAIFHWRAVESESFTTLNLN